MLDINSNSLYKDVLMEHYNNSKTENLTDNKKIWSIKNPMCGDEISLQIDINNNVIKDIYYNAKGCLISMASCSIMKDNLINKTIDEAIETINNYVKMIKGEKCEHCRCLKDAAALKGICNFPARFKCATIAWEGILNALNEIKNS